MATTTTHDVVNFPHLLKMVGDVINNDTTLNRSVVQAALFSNTNPIGDMTGKVDFIICFNCTGGGPDWASENHSAAFAPRPLRGIVQIHKIDLANDSQLDKMGPLFSLLLQEMGHYWIRGNAGQAKIRTTTGDVDTPTAADIVAALNAGGPYPPYPMMGRGDSHWSPFLNGDNSPFEASRFGPKLKTEGIGFLGLDQSYTQVESIQKVGPDVYLPGSDGGIVTTTARYSPLELWLMGDSQLPARPSFEVIEPIWVFPLPFQAGLFVELRTGERYYFGYDQGPHRLGAYRTRGERVGISVYLANDPFGPTEPYDPHDAIGLRVVQVGTTIRLQVHIWPAARYSISGRPVLAYEQHPDCNWVLGDLQSSLADPGGGTTDAYAGWKTIATQTGSVQRVGLSSRTLQTGRDNNGNPIYGTVYARLGAKLCLLNGGNLSEVDVATLAEDIPRTGPARLANGQLMMPYRLLNGTGVSFPEDSTFQQAPKWTMQAPNGDFAFGGAVRLESCAMVSWAGGGAVGKTLVGPIKQVKYNDFLLPADPFRARRVEPPYNGAYKVLFCAVSRTDPEIDNSKLTQLDRIRRAFQIYYSAVTSRDIDTTIP